MSFSSLPLYIVHISGPKKIFLKEKKKRLSHFQRLGEKKSGWWHLVPRTKLKTRSGRSSLFKREGLTRFLVVQELPVVQRRKEKKGAIVYQYYCS